MRVGGSLFCPRKEPELHMKRIGIVGFGFIGASLYRAIEKQEIDGLQVAFVFNRSPGKLRDVPADLVLQDLSRAAERRPDLIVECAHPDISIDYGADFLSHCDYMPLSVTALADDALRETLTATARASGHHMLLPRGALAGADV